MSQSATLYRITAELFQMIEKMEGKQIKPGELTNSYVTFQGSFMGLETVLSKGLKQEEKELIIEIFNPVHYIGPADTNIFNLDDGDEEAFWEMESAIGYLKPNKVKLISTLLNTLHESEVAAAYNAEEMNAEGVYPSCWHNEEGTDKAFGRQQLLEDFGHLKGIFLAAAEENSYVLSCVG